MGACTLMTVLYSFFPPVEGLSNERMISEATSGSSVLIVNVMLPKTSLIF